MREIPGEELRFVTLSCRELPSLSKTAQCASVKEIPDSLSKSMVHLP
jgi:hypothetical protein